MPSDDRELYFDNFGGGINEAVAENRLGKHETPKTQNIDFTDGNLKRCSGIVPFTSAVLPGEIGSIMTYYKNKVGQLIVASGNSLYKYENNQFVMISEGFTSDKFSGINFKINDDVLILGNGKEGTLVYDGQYTRYLKNRMPLYDVNNVITGWMDSSGVTHGTEAECLTLAPKSKLLDLHYERIWAADDNTVYFSTANENGFDIEDWMAPTSPEEEINQHGGAIDIYTNDGGTNIALKVVFDDVLIFRDTSIFKIFGTYPGEYRKVQLFSATGAIAAKSIVKSNYGAFFVNKDAIYLYGGTDTKPISAKIDKTFKGLNENAIQNAVAIFHDNKYILAVPEGSSTDNNLIIIYDVLRGTFDFRRGYIVTDFCKFEDKVLFTSTNGKIYVLDSGSSYDSQQIYSTYETGNSDLGFPNGEKITDYIYFTGKGDGDLKVTILTERSPIEGKSKTVTLTAVDKVYTVKINHRGRWLKLKFENVNGSYFEIKSVKVIYELDID